MPEIRTFTYLPSIYDTSKYYKSELQKQGSMEYEAVPEADDSDDEDEASPLITRNGYLLQEILSDFDELSGWRLNNLPTDLHSVQNALLMRVSCHNRKHCWPLLIDPDNQAEIWVTALQTSRNVFSERDVRDRLPEYDDMPLEACQSKDTNTEPPPSRGTALTYSSEFTLQDDFRTDTSGFITATSSYSKRYKVTEHYLSKKKYFLHINSHELEWLHRNSCEAATRQYWLNKLTSKWNKEQTF